MIFLQNLLPVPLKEMPGGSNQDSGIFGMEAIFEKGKNYLVSAASGKGKSTLLHILYGLRKDYEGHVFLEKKDIQTFTLDDWASIRQTQLSIVFQDLRLFTDLTAMENLQLKNALTNKFSDEEIRSQAALLGVEDLLGQACRTLSYGQRQRIAILRALCQPFDLLMLDEPFSHLDKPNIRQATQLIKNECASQNAGLIMSSLGEPYFFDYHEKLDI